MFSNLSFMHLLIAILSNSIPLSLRFETYIFLKRGKFKKKKKEEHLLTKQTYMFLFSLSLKGSSPPKYLWNTMYYSTLEV